MQLAWMLTTVLVLLAPPSYLSAQAPTKWDRIDFDSLRKEATSRLSEYLRINTSNPPGNELAAARWLEEVLAREGIESQILDTTELGPGRANFYARLKGNGSGKAIALVHHMDVVPADPKFWTVDPFSGAVKDGAVWGRGALDMKGQGIIQLFALIAIKRAGIPLPRDIVFIANADEEATSLGAQTFVQRHRDLLQDVEFLLTESDETRVEQGKVRWFGIDVGEKRSYWQRLTVQGVASHGSQPTPYNPVPRLARIIARLAAWETPLHLTPAVERYFKAQAQQATGRARVWLADPAAALRTSEGRAWLLSDPERNALLRNTISPTVLVGSDKINSIPSAASVDLDIRLLPDQDPEAFKRELLRVIADTGARLTQFKSGLSPKYNAPLNTEMVRAIERTVRHLLPGVPIATPINTGGSDRPYYADQGIICYGLAPFLVDRAEQDREYHGVDERMPIASLDFGLRLYVGILQEILEAKSSRL
jgi:acetylornithine deacetylase/succinyl-diaminopimelate desuccinylase-like protein